MKSTKCVIKVILVSCICVTLFVLFRINLLQQLINKNEISNVSIAYWSINPGNPAQLEKVYSYNDIKNKKEEIERLLFESIYYKRMFPEINQGKKVRREFEISFTTNRGVLLFVIDQDNQIKIAPEEDNFSDYFLLWPRRRETLFEQLTDILQLK